MDQGVEEGRREPIGIDVVNFVFDSAWIKMEDWPYHIFLEGA